jgi:hypothetical protein
MLPVSGPPRPVSSRSRSCSTPACPAVGRTAPLSACHTMRRPQSSSPVYHRPFPVAFPRGKRGNVAGRSGGLAPYRTSARPRQRRTPRRNLDTSASCLPVPPFEALLCFPCSGGGATGRQARRREYRQPSAGKSRYEISRFQPGQPSSDDELGDACEEELDTFSPPRVWFALRGASRRCFLRRAGQLHFGAHRWVA